MLPLEAAASNVNIVTKRGGNKWEGNASYYYANDSLQGNNYPNEVFCANWRGPIRIDEIKDYGFDVGGPIWKDKFFAWGAYSHKNRIGIDHDWPIRLISPS